MGLLSKLKDTFFEEEYVEVEDEKEEEKVAKKVEPKKIVEEKKEEPKIEEEKFEELDELDEEPVVFKQTSIEEEEILDEEPESYSDRDLVNKNSKLTYFDDEDFEPTKPISVVKKEEPKRIYGEDSSKLYSSINLDDLDKYNMPNHKAYGAPINQFEPTPIISPIYGILDKNYRKEEVVDKKDRPSSYVSRKDIDLDSVRRKAYGDVSIMGEEEAKTEDENVVYDTNFDDKPVVGDVTVADAEEYFNDLGLEYNVDYKDATYEKAAGRRSDVYKDEDEEVKDNGLEEVEIADEYKLDDRDEEITIDDIIKKKQEELEDANLDNNLFDLVDSVYGDGE